MTLFGKGTFVNGSVMVPEKRDEITVLLAEGAGQS